jgi:ABC-type transport system involved in multi-copper enzyme maturation permease subunit
MITTQTNPPNSVRRKPTHGLLWKEIWENKMLVVWAIGLTAAFVAGDYTLYSINGTRQVTLDPMCLYAVWVIMATLCGSSMVSPEVGSASLQFLSSLPLSRNRLWWTKLLAQFTLHVISLFVTLCASDLVAQIIFGLQAPFGDSSRTMTAIAAAISIPVFCVAALMTVFTDRTITTFFISAIVSIIFGSIILGFMSLLMPAHYWVIGVLLAVLSVSILGISHELFVRGETMRTAKRFAVLREISLFDILPIVLALVLAYIWLMH